MDKIIVSLVGFAVVAAIYWFFLLKRTRSVTVGNVGALTVTVEGGYTPDSIEIKRGRPVALAFLRTDPSSCLEEVVIPGFRIRKRLPLGKEVVFNLNPQETGEFPFSCGMNMYHGKIIVTE